MTPSSSADGHRLAKIEAEHAAIAARLTPDERWDSQELTAVAAEICQIETELFVSEYEDAWLDRPFTDLSECQWRAIAAHHSS